MGNFFESITKSEYETLEWMLKNEPVCPADRFFDDPVIDGRISRLEQIEFILHVGDGEYRVSELGRAALVEHHKSEKIRMKKKTFEFIKFAIPTILSIAAFIKSFFC